MQHMGLFAKSRASYTFGHIQWMMTGSLSCHVLLWNELQKVKLKQQHWPAFALSPSQGTQSISVMVWPCRQTQDSRAEGEDIAPLVRIRITDKEQFKPFPPWELPIVSNP